MANYSFAVWIILSIGLLVLFAYAAVSNLRRQHSGQVGLGEIVPNLLPVDLEAFVEAIDPSHEARLRQFTSRREFYRQQRLRGRVAAEHLRRMSRNAALLQRVGYGMIHSGNPLLVAQAEALIDAGVHVRFFSFMGLASIFFKRVAGISLAKAVEAQKNMSSRLVPAYETLRAKAQDITALRDTDFRDALIQAL